MQQASGRASAGLLWIVLLGAMAGLGYVALDRATEPPTPEIEDVGGKASSEEPASMSAEAPPVPTPQRLLSALAREMGETPALFKKLVDAARLYFDLDAEQWKGREALLTELEAHAAAGRYVLKDMDAVRWLVYQARSFDPQMTDRTWQKASAVQEAKSLGNGLYWLKSKLLRLTWSVPKTYPKKNARLQKAYPRDDPLPVLLAMHDDGDTQHPQPGKSFLDHHYPRTGWSTLYDNWGLLCPEANGGDHFKNPTSAAAISFRNAMSNFWRHYHVDFDRIVLDGSKQAFTAAASMSVFFAGVILHGSWALEKSQLELVPNLAPVPVFVVDNPALATQLREAGHEQVTEGRRDAALMTWMSARRRVHPKDLAWTVQPKRLDQVLPYWINLDKPDWEAPRRHLSVKVIDTEEAPNSILIQALGVDRLSIFLNDAIVDLDRPVRVVINGHVEHQQRIGPGDRFAQVGRNLDVLFNREPVRIRTSMYFGWLMPARIVGLDVRPPLHAPEPPPPPAEVVADPPRDPPEQDSRFPLLTVLLALAAFAAALLLMQQRRRG